MHGPHVSSGGRYPVLRTLAILYLFAAVVLLVLGVWRAISILTSDGPINDVFGGVATNMGGRALVALSWLATTFIGVLVMFGIAELIKLFIDIERNTRVAGIRATDAGMTAGTTTVASTSGTIPGATVVTTAPAGTASAGDGTNVGEGVPGGSRVRQLLEGEETAEGALIRGH